MNVQFIKLELIINFNPPQTKSENTLLANVKIHKNMYMFKITHMKWKLFFIKRLNFRLIVNVAVHLYRSADSNNCYSLHICN